MPFGDDSPFEERTMQVNVVGDTDQYEAQMGSAITATRAFRLAVVAAGLALAGGFVIAVGKSVQAASTWEDKLVEIAKVTDEATADALNESLIELSQTMPVAATELAEVAEVAGRLGVEGSDNINRFTETVAKLDVATNIAAKDAAEDFARIANALDTPIVQIENMGSAVNSLANNIAASTDEILDSMVKAAPAAAQLGVEFDELAAIQATLVASGMRVSRAGTRMNRAFTLLSVRADEVAQAMGMSVDEFNRLLETDPTQALMAYLEHLNSIESSQRRVNEATEIFGTSGAKAVLTLANNMNELKDATELSEQSFKDAESAQREYEAANETLSSEVQRLKNNLFALGTSIGDQVSPELKLIIEDINRGIKDIRKFGQIVDKVHNENIGEARRQLIKFADEQGFFRSEMGKSTLAYRKYGEIIENTGENIDELNDAQNRTIHSTERLRMEQRLHMKAWEDARKENQKLGDQMEETTKETQTFLEKIIELERKSKKTFNNISTLAREWDLPASISEAYGKSVKAGLRSLDRLRRKHRNTLDQIILDTELWKFPEDIRQKYHETKIQQQRDLEELRREHKGTLDQIKGDVEVWQLDDETFEKYQETKAEQKIELQNMKQEHRQTLDNILLDTKKSKLPEETRKKYEKTKKKQDEILEKIKRLHFLALIAISGDTRNWNIASVWDDQWGSVESKVDARLNSIEMMLASTTSDARGAASTIVAQADRAARAMHRLKGTAVDRGFVPTTGTGFGAGDFPDSGSSDGSNGGDDDDDDRFLAGQGDVSGLQEGGIVPPGVNLPAMLHGGRSGEAVIPLDKLGDLGGGNRLVVKGDLIVEADDAEEFWDEVSAHLA